MLLGMSFVMTVMFLTLINANLTVQEMLMGGPVLEETIIILQFALEFVGTVDDLDKNYVMTDQSLGLRYKLQDATLYV